MTPRRDHFVGGALLAGAGAAFALSGDLPIGTPGSPGPGMLPHLAIGLIAVLSLTIAAGGHRSPPLAATSWADLPHALTVTAAAGAAALCYERAGFVITMSMLVLTLLVLVERVALWRAALYALGVALGIKLVLGAVLKSPLPLGPLGI